MAFSSLVVTVIEELVALSIKQGLLGFPLQLLLQEMFWLVSCLKITVNIRSFDIW